MYAKTPAVMALAGTALAIPTAAQAADPNTDPASPATTALHAPVAGHLTVAGQMRAARAARQRKHLSAEATRLARRVAASHGRAFHPARFRASLRGDSVRTLRTRLKGLRAQRTPQAGTVSTPGYLQAIAACESGGNPTTNTGNGF